MTLRKGMMGNATPVVNTLRTGSGIALDSTGEVTEVIFIEYQIGRETKSFLLDPQLASELGAQLTFLAHSEPEVLPEAVEMK